VIGIDTNVIVRYLTQDDRVQSLAAKRIFEQRLTAERPGFISVVVMVETAWVLERAYRASRRAIAASFEALLTTDTLVIESEQEVYLATISLLGGTASFADALIAALGAKAGCSYTLTFDRKASQRLADFVLV